MAIGTIGLGVAVGYHISVDMLKYTANVYETKIEELSTLNSDLDSHLSRLQDLKSQMSGFWNDDKAEDTGLTLDQEIRLVREASSRVKNLKEAFVAAKAEMDTASGSASGFINQAIEAVQNLKG